MEIVDKQRRADRELFSNKGSKPTLRLRKPGHGNTGRNPPTDKPKAIFDKTYLDNHRNQGSLMFSDGKMPWLNIGGRPAGKKWMNWALLRSRYMDYLTDNDNKTGLRYYGRLKRKISNKTKGKICICLSTHAKQSRWKRKTKDRYWKGAWRTKFKMQVTRGSHVSMQGRLWAQTEDTVSVNTWMSIKQSLHERYIQKSNLLNETWGKRDEKISMYQYKGDWGDVGIIKFKIKVKVTGGWGALWTDEWLKSNASMRRTYRK
jgi:hypothetical protein